MRGRPPQAQQGLRHAVALALADLVAVQRLGVRDVALGDRLLVHVADDGQRAYLQLDTGCTDPDPDTD
ncbi:hypothetical protein AB0D27_44270 [Streptomyces sp. NPDC048415]|uniref:hypothetical protein n=1 Tax=Streptomyces sp. NPDC048415 TaxID=3154822 RepID=UPI00342A8E95